MPRCLPLSLVFPPDQMDLFHRSHLVSPFPLVPAYSHFQNCQNLIYCPDPVSSQDRTHFRYPAAALYQELLPYSVCHLLTRLLRSVNFHHNIRHLQIRSLYQTLLPHSNSSLIQPGLRYLMFSTYPLRLIPLKHPFRLISHSFWIYYLYSVISASLLLPEEEHQLFHPHRSYVHMHSLLGYGLPLLPIKCMHSLP